MTKPTAIGEHSVAFLEDVAVRAIRHHLDRASTGDPNAFSTADLIRIRMGWSWEQIIKTEEAA